MAGFSRKKVIAIIALMLVAAGLLLYPQKVTFEKDILYIQSDTRMWPVNIEIAKTGAQQRLGLMFRRKLNKNAGMLFIPPKETVMTMWMKNTRIRLDILFIDRDGKIVYIAENARPKSLDIISANRPVRAVLELPGGITKERKIKIGDQVIYSVFDAPAPRN